MSFSWDTEDQCLHWEINFDNIRKTGCIESLANGLRNAEQTARQHVEPLVYYPESDIIPAHQRGEDDFQHNKDEGI